MVPNDKDGPSTLCPMPDTESENEQGTGHETGDEDEHEPSGAGEETGGSGNDYSAPTIIPRHVQITEEITPSQDQI